ncbi:unnamed protein product [Lota lota]
MPALLSISAGFGLFSESKMSITERYCAPAVFCRPGAPGQNLSSVPGCRVRPDANESFVWIKGATVHAGEREGARAGRGFIKVLLMHRSVRSTEHKRLFLMQTHAVCMHSLVRVDGKRGDSEVGLMCGTNGSSEITADVFFVNTSFKAPDQSHNRSKKLIKRI